MGADGREREEDNQEAASPVAGPTRHRTWEDTCPWMLHAVTMLGFFIFKQKPHIFILLWAPQMMQLVLAGKLCVAG